MGYREDRFLDWENCEFLTQMFSENMTPVLLLQNLCSVLVNESNTPCAYAFFKSLLIELSKKQKIVKKKKKNSQKAKCYKGSSRKSISIFLIFYFENYYY